MIIDWILIQNPLKMIVIDVRLYIQRLASMMIRLAIDKSQNTGWQFHNRRYKLIFPISITLK